MNVMQIARAMLLAAAATSMLAPPAWSQEAWPKAKPIKWLIGLPPGGGVDPITRAVADRLGPRLGATFIIENKPGANQALAANEVGRSEPDGYTLFSFGGPTLYNRPVSEIGHGLDPVAHLSSGPMILAGTTKNVPVDLKALLAAMKASPEKWSLCDGRACLDPPHRRRDSSAGPPGCECEWFRIAAAEPRSTMRSAAMCR